MSCSMLPGCLAVFPGCRYNNYHGEASGLSCLALFRSLPMKRTRGAALLGLPVPAPPGEHTNSTHRARIIRARSHFPALLACFQEHTKKAEAAA
mmetsp:Transcript_4390/g.12322  ORF Transcript_4390/g.12322 Transcript_4390/m.12322 type:complete len:94 (-) Transcript_4390:107-388(-)